MRSVAFLLPSPVLAGVLAVAAAGCNADGSLKVINNAPEARHHLTRKRRICG